MLTAYIIFEFAVLPWAQNLYEYIAQSYTLQSCILLGIMYVTGVFVVLSVMFRIKLKNNIFEMYCE